MKLLIITNIISLVAGSVLCCLVLKLTEFPKFIKDIWAKIWYIASNFILFLIYAILYYLRLVWFIAIFILTCSYCKNNWMEIILLDKINANAIIFLLFIFLLIYPLISNFKIGDISGNLLYQNLLLLNGKNANIKKSKKMYNTIIKMSIQKYLANKENEDYIQKFEETKKAKQERLELFEHKRDLLDKITEEKKDYTKQIEQIDRTLNNNELLKKEYYERNKNLPNKEKIFSVSYLVGILEKERKKLLEGIEECNKIILPKEYVEQKSKLEEETRFLESIQIDIYRNDIVEICKEFLENVKNIIKGINEENKNKLITWIYKIRYYRYIPISETESVKDLQELNDLFEEVIKLIIKKLQKFKIWDTFSEDEELNYKILKEIFNTKIIYLQSINIQCRLENKVLIVEYYDDTVIDSSLEVHIDSVKIKKKFKLFM